MDKFRDIYDKELGLNDGADNMDYTPLEVVILDSFTIRAFVYEVCKKMLKEKICEVSNWNETAKDLADKHVDWFLEAVRPLLVEHFIHGYKHGMDRLGISEQATKRDAENLVGCEVCGRLDGSHHSDCKYYNPRE